MLEVLVTEPVKSTNVMNKTPKTRTGVVALVSLRLINSCILLDNSSVRIWFVSSRDNKQQRVLTYMSLKNEWSAHDRIG